MGGLALAASVALLMMVLERRRGGERERGWLSFPEGGGWGGDGWHASSSSSGRVTRMTRARRTTMSTTDSQALRHTFMSTRWVRMSTHEHAHSAECGAAVRFESPLQEPPKVRPCLCSF